MQAGLSRWCASHLLCCVHADMSLKEALEFLVSLAKEKKKEESRDHGKGAGSQGVNNTGRHSSPLCFPTVKSSRGSGVALL